MRHDSPIGDCYKLENVLKIHYGVFEPIPNKGDPRWLIQINFSKLIHDEDVQKKKRKKKVDKI